MNIIREQKSLTAKVVVALCVVIIAAVAAFMIDQTKAFGASKGSDPNQIVTTGDSGYNWTKTKAENQAAAGVLEKGTWIKPDGSRHTVYRTCKPGYTPHYVTPDVGVVCSDSNSVTPYAQYITKCGTMGFISWWGGPEAAGLSVIGCTIENFYGKVLWGN